MNNDDILGFVSDGLAEIQSGDVYHRELERATASLDAIWHPKPPPAYPVFKAPPPESKAPGRGYDATPAPPKRPPPWHIGMSSGFTKAVSKIDRKLQGHILEALTKITESPTTIHGDTVKPLSGELKGCWRYRIGDYRLIYSPDQSSGDVTLLAFAPRGTVYGD